MIRLRSRTQCAVNGFWFTQPETSFHKQFWDFEQMCREVQAMRAANPRFNLATDMTSIRDEADMQNAVRMQKIRGAESYISVDSGPPPPNFTQPQRRARLLDAAVAVRRLKAGTAALAEWLGEGGQPVAPELAEGRAVICATCPQNTLGDFTRWFTVPASEGIRKLVEARTDLKLATSQDDKLGVCEACLCPLKLKVHVPMANIEKHLTEDVRTRLDPRCWMLKEKETNGTGRVDNTGAGDDGGLLAAEPGGNPARPAGDVVS